jgi:lipoprotein-anchoring transpeptidase ErfK/SrfK
VDQLIVSSGCIRMINQDLIDLYQRTPIGAKVVVLPSR